MTSLAVTDYQRLSEIDHVLQRSGMYIGPIDRQSRKANCYSTLNRRIEEKDVYQAEGQEQTFLEILGNAADNVQRSRDNSVDPGRIEVVISAQWVTVKNYGMNIPVAQNDEGIWVPDMIFGQLRTSSAYDDSKKRLYIGMNGLGAKATNIYSLMFMIECADPARGLLYKQTWQQNMKQRGEPEIQTYSGIGYTQISYSLDFARFGVTNFDSEALEIYAAHCASVSLTCQVPVIFNGETFNIKDVVSYANLFFPITKQSAVSYHSPNGVYDLCLVDTPDAAVCVSFVNGIITKAHGVHVDAAYKVIVDGMKAYLGKAIEGVNLTKRDVINHVSLFLMCRVPNPTFKSQTKDCLARPKPEITLPEEILKGIKRWQLVERLYMEIQRKQINKLKKSDGKKRKRVKNDNLQDANFAKESSPDRRLSATLIAVEGESAASYPVKFISQIENDCGRNYFGILPLHGKLLNVLNANFIQILENRDLVALKEALGLEEEVDYTDDYNYRRLRYGNFLFIPDADNDGKHILGLVLVFFLARFPSLVQRGFFKFLRTPVIRVTGHGQRFMFYTYTKYNQWTATVSDISNKSVWQHEYFKGLGSSEDHHIVEDFQLRKIVTFKIDESAGERIVLAFHKEAAQNRKQWLANLVDRELLDIETFTEFPISIFVNYELTDYSVENIIRSIPEPMDGMKECQRKAFFAALRKLRNNKSKGKTKVDQIASYAQELTSYKHGPSSLADAIKLMTYHFVGSNNMPYFVPRGQFGTRNKGGKDAANPRYTYISLPWWTDKIYRREDKRLEKRIIDEGDEQECENFFPILPMHIINGVVGIGTAYSTNIPAHNPLDVAFWLQQRLLQDIQSDQGHQLPILRPWYKGFTGQINHRPNGFTTEGRMLIQPNGAVLIEELPIGTWTKDYENFLITLEEHGTIADFDSYSTSERARFIIHKYLDGSATPKKLKLISKHSYNNMTVLYRTESRGIRPRTYNNLVDLLQDYYQIRLAKYGERKALMIQDIDKEIHNMSERARFILAEINGELIIRNRPKVDVLSDMDRMRFDHKLLNVVKIYEFIQDNVNALYAKIEEKRREKAVLEQTRPEQIWYSELEEFIVEYCQKEKCQRSTFESCNPTTIIEINTTSDE